MTSYTFSQLIDFTRTTSGTYTNSSGFITSTPASVNLLTYTQDFANAAWTKIDTTVTANNVAAPDGTMTADTLTEGSAGTGQVGATGSVSTAGATATFSIYLKRGNTDWVRLAVTNAANGFRAWFNLNTGTAGSTATIGTGTVTGASIVNAGNGWYRCILTGAIPSVTAYSVFANTASADNSGTRVSGGTYLAWGAQLEQASTATEYTRNYGGLYPPRFDYDPVTLAPKGLLLEEQRTNLLTYSEQFDNGAWSKSDVTVTANTTTSPDGTADADSYVEGTAGTASIAQNFTGTANATFTVTIYVKRVNTDWVRLTLVETAATTNRITGWFNLSTGAVGSFTDGGTGSGATGSVSDAGNGWYRIRLTGAVNNSATALLLSLSSASADNSTTRVNNAEYRLWGAQLEAGAFATSYIPTVASQVTRSADEASINAPNFASWYNQSAGTMVAEFDTVEVSSYAPVAVVWTDLNNRIDLATSSSAASPRGFVNVAGVTQADMLNPQQETANTVLKYALAFEANNFATARNGAITGSDVSGSLPVVSSLRIGCRDTSSTILNGHIRSIRYYPTRLTNTQLQAITA